MRGVWLETLTWPEAKDLFDAGRPVLLPIGAIAKEHGHHLPLNTDWLYARALTERVLAELPVVAAPIVSAGFYPAFVRYPGSQHLSAETFRAILRETLQKLIADGVRNLAVLNLGVSTEPVLRIAVRDVLAATGVRVHTADVRDLGRRAVAQQQQHLGGHADENETSVILAIDPTRVRMEKAVPDYGNMLEQPQTVFYSPVAFGNDPASGVDHSVTGVRGDPTLATAEKGEALLAEMAGELIDGLRQLFPDQLSAP